MDDSPWDAIENPPLRELCDSDWDLLQALSDGQTGSMDRWAGASVQQLLRIMELPGPRLQQVLQVLLTARPDDCAAALEHLGSGLIQLAWEGWRQSEPASAPQQPPGPTGPLQRHATRATSGRARAAELKGVWGELQSDPVAARLAIEAVHEIWAGDGSRCERLDQLAPILGLCRRGPLAGVVAAVNKRLVVLGGEPIADAHQGPTAEQANAWSAAVRDPHGALWRLAEIAATTYGADRWQRSAAVVGLDPSQSQSSLIQAVRRRTIRLEAIAANVESMPEPAGQVETLIVGSQVLELGPYPPLSPAELLAEALDPARREATTMQAIAGWRSRPGLDWRRWFLHLRDHLGPSAAAAIAEATGADFAEVVAHGQAVMARHQSEREQLRGAYTDLAELLADACEARGWQWFAMSLDFQIESLWGHCAELHRQEGEPPADQRPGAT